MRRFALVAALSLLPFAAFAAGKFALESAEIRANATIAETHVYKGFGCDGGNVSPSLHWKNAPAGTKSFAVTVFDPDAPTGSGWWHWVVFNLPADVVTLPLGAGDPASGKAPRGAIQSVTDFGAPGYGGPCPQPGAGPHRYVFTVHALKADRLDLDARAMPALVGYTINAERIGKASFTATYGRK